MVVDKDQVEKESVGYLRPIQRRRPGGGSSYDSIRDKGTKTHTKEPLCPNVCCVDYDLDHGPTKPSRTVSSTSRVITGSQNVAYAYLAVADRLAGMPPHILVPDESGLVDVHVCHPHDGRDSQALANRPLRCLYPGPFAIRSQEPWVGNGKKKANTDAAESGGKECTSQRNDAVKGRQY